MELDLSNTLMADDPRLIDHIVGEVKSRGIFDQFRKECIADVDTKPAYQNLRTRVEGSVNSFLSKQVWKPDLNKNQLRETLRKHIHDAPYLDAGVERIVDQVVNPKVYSVFMPQIEDVVYKFLGIERPKIKEKNGACGLKDLLPKDLDPVSPESDKNSLKDVSLESIDAHDNIDEKQNDKTYDEQKLPGEEVYQDKNKDGSENGHIFLEEKMSDEVCKTLNKTGSSLNLNISGRSDDKMDEEEEEVSPTFEPIDIMNLNESNISNDSHLSGISELTSHRSRSPDFSNELSRDNFDCSNQDSQLSKVSSDSRLSIVTDFGSSNHGLTPVHDTSKDEATKDKCETKNNKDNFKAIREFDSSKTKTGKSSSFDFSKSKDTQDYKDSKDFKSTKGISLKENSRDATDSGIKDKYEHKSSKEKNKDSETIKSSKSTKEKISNKDTKYYKDRSNEKKKTSSHSSMKHNKHNKNKLKDKIDPIRESSDKAKDLSENLKDNFNKLKDEKETEKKDNRDKKDNINKEAKDLKDLYKEKIRELREKKELTEKEKLNKDKEIKLIKETKERKDSPKDKKSDRKDHKSSSSSSSSSSSKNLPVAHHESKSNKTSEKIADGKDKRSDSKDKAKRDEKRLSKDSKSKSHSSKTDLSEKSDSKKIFKNEKEDKVGKADVKRDVKASGEKTNGKKDAKNYPQQSKSSDRGEKLDRKDSKNDSPSKEKKRREEKKSKMKDDHSSLRKNSNDRRSTDRDGSNGSNSKTSPSNSSNSNMISNKSGTSSLTKENHITNSGSETSDSIEETQVTDSKSSKCKLSHKSSSQLLTNVLDKNRSKMEADSTHKTNVKQKEEQADSCDTSLPLKKRLLSSKDDESIPDDVKIKKPKFAKNIHEAKKLIKLRKQMEKQRLKEDKKVEKNDTQEIEQSSQSSTIRDGDNLEGVPDDERVQIIEIPDEEYEEPYPEKHELSLRLDERSIIMLGAEPCTNELLNRHSDLKPTLSNMELCIKQSLSEIVTNVSSEKTTTQNSKIDEKIAQSDDSYQQSFISSSDASSTSHIENTEDSQISEERHKDNFKKIFKNERDAIVDTKKDSSRTEKKHMSQGREEAAVPEKLEFMDPDNTEQSTEKNAEMRNYNQVEIQDNNEEARNDNRLEIRDDKSQVKKQAEMCASLKPDAAGSHGDCIEIRSSSFIISEDNEDCRYFKTDNEKSEKFSNFLESLELVENSSLEDIIESLGGKIVSSVPKSMAAPPLPKSRKRSSSPLSDIMENNSDNNNDGHKRTSSSSPNEDAVHNVKRRKFTKKPRSSSLCSSQGISNGENFVMPLSPDSDVSATSEKTTSSNVIKEERSRNRSSQRYSSDDLYKPRLLFSSSSRRSRRSNQT
ncbi:biorientation of chromosomes in cell division protein 1-like 1 [Linepithema humile]|uniref:biorientation of chromosomes in cell division protein 1-like 1 n=1 Tax=Linepithema humile TaxID=83485 RepID=UPI00351EF688